MNAATTDQKAFLPLVDALLVDHETTLKAAIEEVAAQNPEKNFLPEIQEKLA